MLHTTGKENPPTFMNHENRELREKYLAFLRPNRPPAQTLCPAGTWCCSRRQVGQFKDHFWAAASWSSP